MKEADKEENSQTELLQVKSEDLLFTEMGLKIRDEDDRKEIKVILFNLGYPSSELAHLHYRCDRVGDHDVLKHDEQGTVVKKTPNTNKVICPCCGFREQKNHIPTCTAWDDIPRLGQATDLFFISIKHTIYLMLLLSIIFSGFALATNVLASKESCSYYVVCSLTTISEGAKQVGNNPTNDNYYLIQSWLGVGLAVVWSFYFMYMSYKERKQEIESDNRTKSASDFSIMIENMPMEIKQEDFQKIATQNFEAIRSIPAVQRRAPVVEKYNVAQPFYLSQSELKDDQLEELQKNYKEELDQLRSWIKDRIDDELPDFKLKKEERQTHYDRIKKIQEQIIERSKVLRDKMRDEFKKKLDDNHSTNVVFVTFRNSLTMKMLTKLNSQHISDRFRRFFTSIAHNETIPIKGIKVYRAPEPQDVLWLNLGVPDCEVFWRKLLTFTATFVLLAVTFAILYGLSLAQVQQTQNIAISVAISVTITVVNVLIGVVITLLTAKERNFTLTNYQLSLGMKIIFAQLMNMIIVPCIVAYFIKKKVYDTGGLIEDVFFMAVTNSFLSPVMRIIDIGYFIKKLLAKYFNRPVPMLKLSQAELNTKLEGLDFEIGFQYVYFVKTCVFTSFFVSLQPAISFLAVVGLFLSYWAEKYVLFNRSKRPPPGSDIINATMSQIIYLCPLVFGLGGLTWPVFMPNGSPKTALIPNIITCGISVLLFLIPLETICNCCIKEEDRANSDMLYEKERIYFSTQYERRNPATMAEGYKDYLKYLEDLKNKVVNTKEVDSTKETTEMKQQLNQIAMKAAVQSQAGGFAGGNLFFAAGGGFGQQQVPRNNMFNTGLIMQLASQPTGFGGAPMQASINQVPMQQQSIPPPGKVQVYPQPQQQQMGMPQPMFPPQQQRQMQPQFQPQPQFQQPAFGFGFSSPQMNFGAPMQMPQMPQFGFGMNQGGFGGMPQFRGLGSGFGNFNFNMF